MARAVVKGRGTQENLNIARVTFPKPLAVANSVLTGAVSRAVLAAGLDNKVADGTCVAEVTHAFTIEAISMAKAVVGAVIGG